jgi:predicted  nucleic acid-binding Zn-ribbon protein
MAMSVNFRWKAPNIVTPKTDPNGIAEGLQVAGNALFRRRHEKIAEEDRQRNAERQDRMDRIAEEDRQRRIQAEDRQRKLYGETASLIRSRKDERAMLMNRRNEIAAKIAEIESRLK